MFLQSLDRSTLQLLPLTKKKVWAEKVNPCLDAICIEVLSLIITSHLNLISVEK